MEKVVEIALLDFVRMKEHSEVLHPLDKASAVDLFETLMKGGIEFNPTEVVNWLIGVRGWKNSKAEKIGGIAQKAKEGRRQECIRRIYGQRDLDSWVAKAEGGGTKPTNMS